MAVNMDGDDDNPWSNDVPITAAPTSFDFPSSTRADAGSRTSDSRTPHEGIASGAPQRPGSGPPASEAPLPDGRRRWWAVAACASVGLVIGGAAWAGAVRNPGASDEVATDSVPVDSAPQTTEPPFVRTTLPPPTTRAPATPRTTLAEVPPRWADGQIILPDRIGEIAPASELVALTNGGKVLRIDVTTGRTSTFDFDLRRPGSTLHLGETNVLVVNNNGSGRGPTVLPIDGDPITVDVDQAGGINVLGAGPGPDEFTAYIWNPNGGTERPVVIRADGSVDDIGSDDDVLWGTGYVTATGERWITDAGGLYLESTDGATRRISTGEIAASSGTRFLVRECDEQRQCGWFVVDATSDERVAAKGLDGFSLRNQPIQIVELSPDGRTLLVGFWDDQDAMMLDLATGEQVPVTVDVDNQYGNSAVAWSPDSSGYFTVDQGDIVFVDRDTGDTTTIAVEFDDSDAFIDVDIRPSSQ